ncbi:hypothetical protein [Marinoscillum sp. MHG1-6]|uniref:hypothetical protein n=1 Tax=Marinoscillum sp. MHG1-6 TaxID=2959627 RepID=UPI00215702A4|nr:hypothetical protein [Marinoscillum sp. MHG1-6]
MMKQSGTFLVVLATLLLIWACEPQEEMITGSPSAQLVFSTDTVLFDTLLTARTSITKRFRIRNTSNKAVSISSIRLGMRDQSQYSIIVNGKMGSEIQDEVLFGKDSLLVLVDVEIDPQDMDLPYLVKDSIIVDWNGNSANVKLVAWGQDAHFVNAQTICDEVWTAERPYVIYNYAFVDSLCQLTIQPGARVYLDNGAGLYVQGTLKVQGDSGNHVLFRNTRFDENYIVAPGQWSGLVFLESSRDNEIHYAEIENGEIGIGLGYTFASIDGSTILIPEKGVYTSSIEISNTSIRHMSTAGVLAFSSNVKMENSEVFNCGGFTVGNFGGGNYQYDYCTFSNFPNLFNAEDPSFQFSDEVEIFEGYVLREELSMKVYNSIIWGANEEELAFSLTETVNTTVDINNNIIRSKEDLSPNNYGSLEANFPGFVNLSTDIFDGFDFDLDSLAFARDKGLDLNYTIDIKGEKRDLKPDIGAHERIDP